MEDYEIIILLTIFIGLVILISSKSRTLAKFEKEVVQRDLENKLERKLESEMRQLALIEQAAAVLPNTNSAITILKEEFSSHILLGIHINGIELQLLEKISSHEGEVIHLPNLNSKILSPQEMSVIRSAQKAAMRNGDSIFDWGQNIVDVTTDTLRALVSLGLISVVNEIDDDSRSFKCLLTNRGSAIYSLSHNFRDPNILNRPESKEVQNKLSKLMREIVAILTKAIESAQVIHKLPRLGRNITKSSLLNWFDMNLHDPLKSKYADRLGISSTPTVAETVKLNQVIGACRDNFARLAARNVSLTEGQRISLCAALALVESDTDPIKARLVSILAESSNPEELQGM